MAKKVIFTVTLTVDDDENQPSNLDVQAAVEAGLEEEGYVVDEVAVEQV